MFFSFWGHFSILLQTLMCLCIICVHFVSAVLCPCGTLASILSLLSYCYGWFVCPLYLLRLFLNGLFSFLSWLFGNLSAVLFASLFFFYTRLFSLWVDLHLFVLTVNSNKSPQAKGVRGPGETLCLLGPSSTPPPHSDHPS